MHPPSFWLTTTPYKERPSLEGSRRADVVVIGGGSRDFPRRTISSVWIPDVRSAFWKGRLWAMEPAGETVAFP